MTDTVCVITSGTVLLAVAEDVRAAEDYVALHYGNEQREWHRTTSTSSRMNRWQVTMRRGQHVTMYLQVAQMPVLQAVAVGS